MPKKKPERVKRGGLSKAERAYIEEHIEQRAEQISKKLGRPISQVQNFIDAFTGVKSEVRMTLQEELEGRPEWKRFQKQFGLDEQEEFKHQYVQIMSQLTEKEEVLATEELQVFQVITLKILIDRTLEEQKRALDDMSMAHDELQDLRAMGPMADPEERERWETVYEAAKRTNKDCADRYKIYSDKQDKMFIALKSTRDQRVKLIENSSKSIGGWLRLAMEEGQRRSLGDEAETNKIASKKETERLSKPHRYADGTIDQPIFSHETVDKFQEEEV